MNSLIRGLLPGSLIALFKINQAYIQRDMLCYLTRVQMIRVVDSRHLCEVHGLVTIKVKDIT